jgi:CRP/FNR family transcriptional regulator, cyclic AMP receptor protein
VFSQAPRWRDLGTRRSEGSVPTLEDESDIMKKQQPKPAVDPDLALRDLHSTDPSDLLRPSVLAAVSELPEHRRLLLLARILTAIKTEAARKSGKVRTETRNEAPNLPLITDTAVFQRKLADLPIATYQAGETVLTAASTTGRLLILKNGAVAVIKEGVEIGKIAEPGAVFGELSVLLGRPHTADVIAVKTSQFYVANAATLFMKDPVALLYVATILAQRLDLANQALIELAQQLRDDEPRIVIGKTVEKIQGLLGASGASIH